MRIITVALTLCTALLFMSKAVLGGEEKILWPYVCFEPVFICQDQELVGGYGYDVLKTLWQTLDGYEHELMLVPIKRTLQFAKEGRKQLAYGFYKTPEREEFMIYSLPCRISIPTFLVVRTEDLGLFGNGAVVSLEKMLEDTRLKFLLLKSVSFGQGIDEILKNNESRQHVEIGTQTTAMGPNALKMLMSKRIDYFLSLDSTKLDAQSMHITGDFTYIPIKEQDEYVAGYITAPKNEWGVEIIGKINNILRQEVKKEEFFNLFKILIDDTMFDELRVEYDRLIVQPSLR